MAFADTQQRSRKTAIAAVALVHVVIGYALVSGLAQQAFKRVVPPFTTIDIFDPLPPPPPPTADAKPQPKRTPVTTVEPVVPGPIAAKDEIPFVRADPGPATTDTGPRVDPVTPPPPITPSKAQKPSPATNRAGWITTDDYPASAIRAEAQGAVGITVAIDERGRVMACTVTASSGNEALDTATCRLYPRRARFTPALNDAGQPVPTTYNDRVRWQLPQ